MNSLEQHDIHTYSFESTSQIKGKKVGLFCKKNYIFTLFKKRNISSYRDIFGAMHRYFKILYRPISSSYVH